MWAPVDGSCEHGATSTALGAEWLPFSPTIAFIFFPTGIQSPGVCLRDYIYFHLGKLSILEVPEYNPIPEIVLV